MIAVIRYPRKMRISTRITVTDKNVSCVYSAFNKIYLFIRIYLSALVDLMQDCIKKYQWKNALHRDKDTGPAAKTFLSLQQM
jgi:hypothetical protein